MIHEQGRRQGLVAENELQYEPLKLSMKIRSSHGQGIEEIYGLKPINSAEFRTDIFKALSNDLHFSCMKNLPPKCSLVIGVSMYNEKHQEFKNTLLGINKNLQYFEQIGVDSNQIVCVVIVDGFQAFSEILENDQEEHEFFRQFYKKEKILEEFEVNRIEDCRFQNQRPYDEFSHCFSLSKKFAGCAYPVNIIFCVKQVNKRKLNSHLWLFGGFCKLFEPKYTVLIDVGTKPHKKSIFYLYEALEINPNLAGCCGEISPMTPISIWNVIVQAQKIEYKISHIFDRALESVIGYISVLPGAFCAYRWEALNLGTNERDPMSMDGSPLWDDYFKSLFHPEQMGAFLSNIYLAEDRVLCLSLFAKKNKKFLLRYVKKSKATTDVPPNLSQLMAQRRRWINGSWFALIETIQTCCKVKKSNHHCCRKACFMALMVYYLVVVVFSWLLVGFCCFGVYAALNQFGNKYLTPTLSSLYIFCLLMIFTASLGVKPKRVENFFKGLAVVLSLYEILVIGLMAYNLILEFNKELNSLSLYLSGATVVLIFLIVTINCEILSFLQGIVQYFLMLPTYINIFLIYSICNIHDCTWGNRPDQLNAAEKDKLEEFEAFRAKWAVCWEISNLALAYTLCLFFATNPENTSEKALLSYYFTVFGLITVFILIMKSLGGIVYIIIERFEGKLPVPQNISHNLVSNSREKERISNAGTSILLDMQGKENFPDRSAEEGFDSPTNKTSFVRNQFRHSATPQLKQLCGDVSLNNSKDYSPSDSENSSNIV